MFGKLGIALLAAALVAGCMGKSVTLAGRPMIYPQGPGDPPDKVEEVTAGSGVLGKKPTAAPQQTTAAAAAGPQGNVLGSVPRPAWAVQGDTVASAAPPMAPMAPMASMSASVGW